MTGGPDGVRAPCIARPNAPGRAWVGWPCRGPSRTPHPQLLEEMMDNGFPLTTEPTILKEMIPPPSMMGRVTNVVTGATGYATASRVRGRVDAHSQLIRRAAVVRRWLGRAHPDPTPKCRRGRCRRSRGASSASSTAATTFTWTLSSPSTPSSIRAWRRRTAPVDGHARAVGARGAIADVACGRPEFPSPRPPGMHHRNGQMVSTDIQGEIECNCRLSGTPAAQRLENDATAA